MEIDAVEDGDVEAVLDPGHGKTMLEAAERWLRARGAPKLLLLVAEANSGVLEFYERLGFVRSPVVTMGA